MVGDVFVVQGKVWRLKEVSLTRMWDVTLYTGCLNGFPVMICGLKLWCGFIAEECGGDEEDCSWLQGV